VTPEKGAIVAEDRKVQGTPEAQPEASPAPAPAAAAVDRKAVAALPSLEELKQKELQEKMLTPEELARAQELASGYDWRDPMAVQRFGEIQQKDVSGVARQLLDTTRIADADQAGKAVLEFQNKLREIGTGDLKDSEMAKAIRKFVPFASAAERWFQRMQKMGPEFAKTLDAADQEGVKILERYKLSDQIIADCDKINSSLKIDIVAAQKARDAKRKEVAELDDRRKDSNDLEAAQKYEEAVEAYETLERRVTDLMGFRVTLLKVRGELMLLKKGLRIQYGMLKSTLEFQQLLFYTQGTAAVIAQKMERTNQIVNSIRQFDDELVSMGSESMSQALGTLREMRSRGAIDPAVVQRSVQQYLTTMQAEADAVPNIVASLQNAQKLYGELEEQLRKPQATRSIPR
jgi:uncharacterized protein YaaN involved in tellurite resistance